MSYITKMRKEGVRKKVLLIIEEINDILKHYHSEAMGGHSGFNSTLQTIQIIIVEME